MQNLALDENCPREFDAAGKDCEILEFDNRNQMRESLSENFANEIEAWARHALATNGFCDF